MLLTKSLNLYGSGPIKPDMGNGEGLKFAGGCIAKRMLFSSALAAIALPSGSATSSLLLYEKNMSGCEWLNARLTD
jgi:hypothetical protein